MMVYADNAATTCVSKAALDAMLPFLTTNYGNPSSLYSFAQGAKEALEEARATVAELIGAASPREVFCPHRGCRRCAAKESGSCCRRPPAPAPYPPRGRDRLRAG